MRMPFCGLSQSNSCLYALCRCQLSSLSCAYEVNIFCNPKLLGFCDMTQEEQRVRRLSLLKLFHITQVLLRWSAPRSSMLIHKRCTERALDTDLLSSRALQASCPRLILVYVDPRSPVCRVLVATPSAVLLCEVPKSHHRNIRSCLSSNAHNLNLQ